MTNELMKLADAYACAPRFDSAGFRAALQAALEAQAAEIERLNKFIDGIKTAVGNQTLEHFIEKHGNPPPLIAERDALQAKLTAMEAQEPVATVIEEMEHDGCGWCSKVRWACNPVPVGETLFWGPQNESN